MRIIFRPSRCQEGHWYAKLSLDLTEDGFQLWYRSGSKSNSALICKDDDSVPISMQSSQFGHYAPIEDSPGKQFDLGRLSLRLDQRVVHVKSRDLLAVVLMRVNITPSDEKPFSLLEDCFWLPILSSSYCSQQGGVIHLTCVLSLPVRALGPPCPWVRPACSVAIGFGGVRRSSHNAQLPDLRCFGIPSHLLVLVPGVLLRLRATVAIGASLVPLSSLLSSPFHSTIFPAQFCLRWIGIFRSKTDSLSPFLLVCEILITFMFR